MIRIKARKALRDYVLDVDIEAADGEIIVLMGSNGSGKTTVLNLVAGLLRPDEGLIAVGGRTLFDSSAGVDVPPELRNLGYVFQQYALFPHMTVYDNVAFGLRMRKAPAEAVGQRVREELEALGMWELRRARAAKLSGGQMQKVALARGLAIEPALLLLDEPLSALDARSHAAMREVLKARMTQSRIPAVVVLHSLRDAQEIGDRVYVMDRGQVVLSGAPDEILGNEHYRSLDDLLI